MLSESYIVTSELPAASAVPASVIQSTERQAPNPAYLAISEQFMEYSELPAQQVAGPMDTQYTPINPAADCGTANTEDTTCQGPVKYGYDYNFLDEEKASEYNCQICLCVSRDPQQTKCCGGTFCMYCIQQALESCKQCPVCKKTVDLIPDKSQKQKINKLKVQCPIKDCLWIVELADIKAHKKIPHPLSPPSTTPYSTLQRRQQRQGDQDQTTTNVPPQHFNTLPASLHRRQHHQSEEPGASRKTTPDYENVSNYINTLAFWDPPEQSGQSASINDVIQDCLNATPPRPRIPRVRSQTPEPNPPKRPKVSQCESRYENLPLSPPPLDQPPLQPLFPGQMQPHTYQTVPLQGQMEQSTENPPRSQPSKLGTFDAVYENVPLPIPSCGQLQLEPYVFSSTPTEVPDHLNVSIRPRIPRKRSQNTPLTATEQHREDSETQQPNGSQPNPQLPDQNMEQHSQPTPVQCQLWNQLHSPASQQIPTEYQMKMSSDQPLHQCLNNAASLPNESTANLPTSAALDEFGLSLFQPNVAEPPTADHVPDYLNGILSRPPNPCEREQDSLPQINTSDCDTSEPPVQSLPPDLLALVDVPIPNQNDMELSPDQMIGYDPSGFVLSPSPPLGLQPPLAPVIAPAPEGPTLQIVFPLTPDIGAYENIVASPPPQATDVSPIQLKNVMMLPSFLETSQSDYINAFPLQPQSESDDYVPMFQTQANRSEYTVVFQGQEANGPDHIDVTQPQAMPQPEYVNVPELRATSQPDMAQPDYIDVPHTQAMSQPDCVEIHPLSQPDYVDMAQVINQPDYVDVPRLQVTNRPDVQAEDADMSQPPTENTNVIPQHVPASERQLPAPPEDQHPTVALPPPQEQEENYATIPIPDDVTDHIYEPLPPDRPPPSPPQEPEQTNELASIPPPPPPLLPPRAPLPLAREPEQTVGTNEQAPISPPVGPNEQALISPPPLLLARSPLPPTWEPERTVHTNEQSPISPPARPPPLPPEGLDEHSPPPLLPGLLPPTREPELTVHEQAPFSPPPLPPQSPEAQAAQLEQGLPVPTRPGTESAPTMQPATAGAHLGTLERQRPVSEMPQPTTAVGPQAVTAVLQLATVERQRPATAEPPTNTVELLAAIAAIAEGPRLASVGPQPDQAQLARDEPVQLLREIRQASLNITESPPPQYDDLSQRPDLILAARQGIPTAAPPANQALIIHNENVETPPPPPAQSPLRIENVAIQYERGDNTHHRNRSMKKAKIIL